MGSTTIRISSETKDRFNAHGKKGQSSDDLLNEILDKKEETEKKRK